MVNQDEETKREMPPDGDAFLFIYPAAEPSGALVCLSSIERPQLPLQRDAANFQPAFSRRSLGGWLASWRFGWLTSSPAQAELDTLNG
jgi:hypothetical protein